MGFLERGKLREGVEEGRMLGKGRAGLEQGNAVEGEGVEVFERWGGGGQGVREGEGGGGVGV